MTLKSHTRLKRSAKLGSFAALLATAAALIVLPAASASAMAIDCSYGGDGLKSYIGDGRDGVTCAGGGGTGYGAGPGSPSGTSGKPGQAPSFNYGCSSAPGIPDDFYNHGPILSYNWTSDLSAVLPGTKTYNTEYYRSGKRVATRTIVTVDGVAMTVYFDDFSLTNGTDGAMLMYRYGCSAGSDWTSTYSTSFEDPANWNQPVVMGLPGTPKPANAPREMLTNSSLSAVPGSPNKFFLRVDVTNNQSIANEADIDLGLDTFSVLGVLGMPGDASCPFATSVDQRCAMPNIAPGATETMTLLVKATPTASTTATLPITTTFMSTARIDSRLSPVELSRTGAVTASVMPIP